MLDLFECFLSALVEFGLQDAHMRGRFHKTVRSPVANASTSNTDVNAHGGARVADVMNLGKKKREESRSFHRAVGYYAGLCRFYGRELSAGELGLRGRKVEVLEAVREAALG